MPVSKTMRSPSFAIFIFMFGFSIRLGFELSDFGERPQAQPTITTLCNVLMRSLRRLRVRKLPGAVENFRARAVETHGVVPAFHDRNAVWNFAIATAEMNRRRP